VDRRETGEDEMSECGFCEMGDPECSGNHYIASIEGVKVYPCLNPADSVTKQTEHNPKETA
jgi:hypothetical protein